MNETVGITKPSTTTAPQTTQHACPNCGYCPHCGRASGPRFYPWWGVVPPYPTWPQYPTFTYQDNNTARPPSYGGTFGTFSL